jgi:hypothetical protein
MTYGALYNLFMNRDEGLIKDKVDDYRPAGRYRLKLWLKDKRIIFVTYFPELDAFGVKEADPHTTTFDWFKNRSGVMYLTCSVCDGMFKPRDSIINYCPVCGRKVYVEEISNSL